MKKNSKIIIVLILVILAGILVFLGTQQIEKPGKGENPVKGQQDPPIPEYEYLDENQKYVIDNVVALNDYLIDPKKTSNDFGKLTNNEAKYYQPMVGKDSLHNIGITEIFESTVKNQLASYITAQKVFVTKLEKIIKETYKYELVETPLYTEDKSQLMQQIKVTPFNYELYKRDLSTIQEYLLKQINKEELKETAEDEIYRYKSRIKAMDILNSQLDNYKPDETIETNIVYNVKDKKDCYSCMFYMNYATGVYSTKNLKGLDDVYAKTQNERLNNIIAKAKNDKIYDSNDPLKLGSQIKE